MSLSRTILSLGLLISSTNTAFGDISGRFVSTPTPPMVAPVKIVEGKVDDIDPNAVAKIIIPSSLLPDLKQSASFEGLATCGNGHRRTGDIGHGDERDVLTQRQSTSKETNGRAHRMRSAPHNPCAVDFLITWAIQRGFRRSIHHPIHDHH